MNRTLSLILASSLFSLPAFSSDDMDSETQASTNALDAALVIVNETRSGTRAAPPGGEPGEGEAAGPASEDIFARLNEEFTISPHTSELLGEQIDVNNGNVMFRNTDLVIPGNGLGLDIVISRTLTSSANAYSRYATFGDWSLDAPAIQTTLLKSATRYSGSWGLGKECSGTLNPGPISNWGSVFESFEYWNGDSLQLPGGNSVKLLENNGYLTPSSTYRRVTQSNWKFSCFNRADGQGEGFIGYAPNGLKYTFDKLRLIKGKSIVKAFKATNRFNAFMLATKIEDRFGNFIKYNYTGNNLTSITTSDSRTVTFTYNHPTISTLITSVTFNNRTWNYNYSVINGRTTLTKVTRPDGKFWDYELSDMVNTPQPSMSTSGYQSECEIVTSAGSYSVSITHPDGVKGVFLFVPQLHGRSNVTKYATPNVHNPQPIQPRCYVNYALSQKTLLGSGMDTLRWQYSYSGNEGTWTSTTPTTAHLLPSSAPVNLENHKSTTVEAPDGSKTVFYYNRDFTSFKEGSLVLVDRYDTNGTSLLSRTESGFTASPVMGNSDVEFENNSPNVKRVMLSSETISKVESSTNRYTTTYSGFDKYGNPQLTSESNNFNNKKRYTKQFYYNDLTNWLIGLASYTQLSENGSAYTETRRTTYHSATGSYKSLPNEQRAFRRWYKRNTSYHTTGVNAGLPYKVNYNGANRWVEYSNYKRGIAQTIKTPQSTSTSAQYAYKVVDNNGWVTKLTDFMGTCISYDYDDLGRMILIDPCDSKWQSTQVSYLTTSGSDGLNHVEAGMLKQTITKGNYQKVTYFDSLLRPIINKEWDKTASSTARYIRQQFDAFNRPTYQSLTQAANNTPYGVVNQYDGLGRPKVVDDNTTSGSVSYRYLSNNRVQVNDNKGNVTTTTYLAYGSPVQNMATKIAAPHSSTTLNYNIYGNVTSVNQGGITEARVYDSYQQLCKIVRPDVGNKALSKNALGQVTWQAAGSSVDSSTTACDTSVNANDKATFAYDNLGNIKSVLFGDSSPNQSYVYDANSRLTRLTAGSVVTEYQYNTEDLIEKETLSVDGQSFVLDYAYNSNGYLTNTIYPSGANIAYLPNALGQASQVANYSSNASYFANGMVKSHRYGNGFTHTATQTSSGLPATFYDVRSGTYALNHGFSYDANSNITAIDDKINNAYDLSLTYDGLDRLDVINDSYLGAGDVNYDAMGNITYYKLGNQALTYYYNASKQLDYVTGSKSYDFSYDDKGNVTDNGKRGFVYNTAEQLVESDGYSYTYDGNNKRVKEVGSTGISYSFYASNGKLMYRQVNGEHVDYYYLGGKLIAKKKGATVSYLHADYLGSTAAESTTSGVVTSRMHYQPFGESIEAAKDDVGYTGHKFDTDLGLSYMQARYYDPVIGRFYSNDPLGFRDVHSFNRYAYANNNPYKYVDLNGMMSSDALAIEKNNYSSCWPHCSSKEKYLSSANDSEGNAPIENGGAVYGGQDESGVHHYTVTYTPSDMAAMAAMESSYLHSQREVARGIYKAVEYGAYAFLAGEIAAASIARWSFLKANEKLAYFGLIGEAASLATGVDGSAAAVMQGAKTLYPRMRVGTSVGKPKVKVNKDGQYIVD